jgi:alkylation response protein AidB-like acyl-CoA dehydrogenase
MDRLGAAARWVGISQEALNYGLAYVKERTQFGRPISKFQSIREIFVDMQTRVDAARLLTYRAAMLMDQKKPCRKEASMAKLFASELVIEVTRNMMHIFGGYGYAMEYHAQRYLRDSLFGTIGAGTSQIQRAIIAHAMGL